MKRRAMTERCKRRREGLYGVEILNLGLLSVTLEFAVQVARILPFAVAGPVTTHEKEPPDALEFWTDAAIWLQVLPLSRLTSSLTVAVAPRLLVQLIVLVEPIVQFDVPVGAVTVIVPSLSLIVPVPCA